MTHSRDVIAHAERKPLWITAAEAFSSDMSVQMPTRFDVVIVGAGYTGLWTALYLKRLDPSLEVAVCDEHTVGHGASGRNGGWCSALLPTPLATLEKAHGLDMAIGMRVSAQRNLYDLMTMLEEHSIACDVATGGTLTVARNQPQISRLRQMIKDEITYGADATDNTFLGPEESNSRINVARVKGAIYTPHCVALHPRKLVDGIARACRELGISIFERTAVCDYSTGTATVLRGGRKSTISCQWVVRASEGYSARFRDARREVIPLYSFMVATEPLSPAVWADIGWKSRETLNDGRHGVIYAQRTLDDRIVFGGRGAPYHFASHIKDSFDVDDKVHEHLLSTLHNFFPAARGAVITHRWGGPLGVPRDWRNFARVHHDKRIAVGGGYTGDGVALAHLTGRMLAHGILRREHPSLSLPWFGHVGPKWEREPLRWLGINSLRLLVESMDAAEARSGVEPRIRNTLATKFLG